MPEDFRFVPFTSADDLARQVAESLGLPRDAVAAAIAARRSSFGRYEDLTQPELFALERAVWAAVTEDAEWPF